jgi:hypothetical protein
LLVHLIRKETNRRRVPRKHNTRKRVDQDEPAFHGSASYHSCHEATPAASKRSAQRIESAFFDKDGVGASASPGGLQPLDRNWARTSEQIRRDEPGALV